MAPTRFQQCCTRHPASTYEGKQALLQGLGVLAVLPTAAKCCAIHFGGLGWSTAQDHQQKCILNVSWGLAIWEINPYLGACQPCAASKPSNHNAHMPTHVSTTVCPQWPLPTGMLTQCAQKLSTSTYTITCNMSYHTVQASLGHGPWRGTKWMCQPS